MQLLNISQVNKNLTFIPAYVEQIPIKFFSNLSILELKK
jgi:hypothetical protein